MHTCVYLVQKILPLPLFILTCGISTSRRFISKHGRSNAVVWIVRLQPVRKESAARRSPVALKALGCSENTLARPAQASYRLGVLKPVFQKIRSACVSQSSRNPRLSSPFSLGSHVSIQGSPQQLGGLVGQWAAPRGLWVPRLHRQREARTIKRSACVSNCFPKHQKPSVKCSGGWMYGTRAAFSCLQT